MPVTKSVLLAGATMLAISFSWRDAQASYAFAANQITGLALTFAGGTPLTGVVNPTSSLLDAAGFTGFAGSTFSGGGPVGTPHDITQATAGPGPFPAENTFTPFGAGMTGTRADSAISGGGAGTVSVSNVAEGNAGAGASSGSNDASIRFSVVGTGQAVEISFVDTIRLIVTTALVGDSATAFIGNSVVISDLAGNVLYSAAPAGINRNISSNSGVPPTLDIGPSALAFDLVSPVLAAGTLYTVALNSVARISITPGTPVPVAEPLSMTLLGAGLLGLGVIRRRRGEG